jgi:hypothetical protein
MKISDLDKKIDLVEQKLDLMLNNHLSHLQEDVRWLKYVVYATAGGIIALLAKNFFGG